ncbi:MAG: hypothetical protein MZW92_78620 [Comamonadaceae bacterium]|nr:hypothetical protein [Comamonadaceae bacterium]
MLEQLFELVAGAGWSDLLVLPFFSMVDRRKSLHEEVIGTSARAPAHDPATEVPYWSEIERMAVRRAPLPALAPRSPAALGSMDSYGPRLLRGSVTTTLHEVRRY